MGSRQLLYVASSLYLFATLQHVNLFKQMALFSPKPTSTSSGPSSSSTPYSGTRANHSNSSLISPRVRLLSIPCLSPPVTGPSRGSGQTGGYNHEARDRDIPFTAKEEPATMPRIEELIIITEFSPWCTIVKNPLGVTLGDVCTTLFKECVPCHSDCPTARWEP